MPGEQDNKGCDTASILLVDDSRLDRRLLERILSKQAYRIYAASSAREALELLGTILPDIILLDVCMPEMDGYELCRIIRQRSQTAATPVIFISANDSSRDRVHAFASGGVDYLCKPIESTEVLARVNTHLTLQTLRRNLEQRVRERTAELQTANLRLIDEMAERRAVEEHLRQRNALINCLIDANIIGIMFLRNDGRLLEANRAFRALFGLQKDEIDSGQINWHDLVMPENRESTLLAMQQVDKTGYCLPYEKICRHRDGQPIPILIGTARLPGEDICISFVLDLSERKRAEQGLRESRQLLRDLAIRADSAMEQERKRIAREIHDEQGSLLTALKLELTLLQRELGETSLASAERLQRMQKLMDETIRVMRQVATQLRPAALNLGLLPSLEWLASDFSLRTGIACRFVAEHDVPLDEARATALFRIVQESLTNITRHAAASQVHIRLETCGAELHMRIHDDGSGFEVASVSNDSFGLRGIGERVALLGGQFLVDSAPGCGTTLRITLPLVEVQA